MGPRFPVNGRTPTSTGRALELKGADDDHAEAQSGCWTESNPTDLAPVEDVPPPAPGSCGLLNTTFPPSVRHQGY